MRYDLWWISHAIGIDIHFCLFVSLYSISFLKKETKQKRSETIAIYIAREEKCTNPKSAFQFEKCKQNGAIFHSGSIEHLIRGYQTVNRLFSNLHVRVSLFVRSFLFSLIFKDSTLFVFLGNIYRSVANEIENENTNKQTNERRKKKKSSANQDYIIVWIYLLLKYAFQSIFSPFCQWRRRRRVNDWKKQITIIAREGERERERMENIWVSFDQTVIASECINLSRKRKRKQESESKAQHFICLNASVCAIYALHLVAIHFPNTSLDAFCRSFVWTLLLPIPWWIQRLNSMVSRIIIIIIIIIAANEDEIRM